MTAKIINTTLLLILTTHVMSQEKLSETNETSERNRITAGLGHMHLSKGKNSDGKTVWLAVPSWSLNYDRRVHPKWRVGLQTDLVLEDFIVEDNQEDALEREKPFSTVLTAMFSITKHLSLLGGAGIEFENEENLGLSRLGIEYGFEIPNGWEGGVSVAWDDKWDHYNSWFIEFSFSKIF